VAPLLLFPASDMPTSERTLDRKLVKGIAWTGGVKWLTQIISWAVTLVVARILTPADYGLFGMAMVYLGLAQLASEAGLQPVVIQPEVLDDELAASIGGLAIMTGIAVCALSAGFAAVVAWFFKEPRVRMLVVALSATFVLRGLQVLPRGLLTRDLDFRRLSWIDAAESMIAALATVVTAFLGYRYWSLVIGAMCGIAVSTVLCFVTRPHRIKLPRELQSIAGSLRLGGHVVTSQFAWYVYSNADFATVGRVLGRTALGAYTFAWTIANVPVDRVTSLVQRVTAPIFAAVQSDKALLRRYVATLTEGLAIVTMPLCVGLAMVAGPLVRVMLPPAWSGAIVPLRLLSLYAAFRCVTSLLAQVLIFTGHAKRNMQLSVLAALVLPVSFYGASQWGTTGVAAVWVTVYPAVIGSLYIHDTLKVIGMRFGEYIRALLSAASAALAMAVTVAALEARLRPVLAPPLLLAALVGAGAAVYTGVLLAMHGKRLRAVLDVVRGRSIAPLSPSHVTGPAAGVAPEPERARLLLVSWHFPPDSAVGGLRWQKFARYAAERGWGVDVIMRDPRALAGCDPERMSDLPAGTRLYFVGDAPLRFERFVEGVVRGARRLRRTAHDRDGHTRAISPSPGSFARAEIRWPRTSRDVKRAYFSAVEQWRGTRWATEAVRVAHGVVDRAVHRAVVSSGPPHFVHAAARAIARDASLPFVMDLRDPWSLVQRVPECIASPVTLALAAREEKKAMREASLVVTNTEPARDLMRARYAATASRIIAVPNGYDDDPIPPSCPASRFTVAYAGTIYLDRDPRPLFRAASQVIALYALTPDDFRIELMGEVAALDGVPIAQMAAEEGVGTFVVTHASRPRADALRFLASASMLVLLPQDSDVAIPAKLFEYMRFDAWLMILASRRSATARLLQDTAADVIAPDDVEGIRRVLAHRVWLHSRGVRAQSLAHHEHLSRRARAAELFDAVEALAGVYDQTSEPGAVSGSGSGVCSVCAAHESASNSASSARHSARTVKSSPMIMPITK
jgi:O-antigen/teichoic acid export membrane protein